MRKAAVVSTGAFVAPTIITVDAADAQALTSPPPEPPGRPGSPASDVGGSPGTLTPAATGTQPPARTTVSRARGRTELPRTGADLDRLVVAGPPRPEGRRSCSGAPTPSPRAPRLLTPGPRYRQKQATGPARSLRERLRPVLSRPEEPGQRHAGEWAGVPGSARAYAADAAGNNPGTTGPPDRPRTPGRLSRDPCTHTPPNRSETRPTSTRGQRRDDRSCSRRAQLSGRSRRNHSSSPTLGASLNETPGRPRFSTHRRLAGSGGSR
jgi:hypothetical protein